MIENKGLIKKLMENFDTYKGEEGYKHDWEDHQPIDTLSEDYTQPIEIEGVVVDIKCTKEPLLPIAEKRAKERGYDFWKDNSVNQIEAIKKMNEITYLLKVSDGTGTVNVKIVHDDGFPSPFRKDRELVEKIDTGNIKNDIIRIEAKKQGLYNNGVINEPEIYIMVENGIEKFQQYIPWKQ